MTVPSFEAANEGSDASPCRLLHRSAQSSTRIRNNLLYKLGVEDNKMPAEEINPREPSRGSLLGRVTVTTEPLKFDEHDETEQKDENSSSDRPLSWGMGFWMKRTESPPEHETSFGSSSVSSRSSSSIESNKRQLAFNPEVAVIPIPRRDEYSNRIRERLWSSAEEMERNARRNALEFAAEKSDWRQVLEEDDMYRFAGTGELIHPVHCEHVIEEPNHSQHEASA